RRWKYSQKKIALKSARVMPLLTRSYCGLALYWSNWACHSAAPIGGKVPEIGSQRVIDRPDSVSRVMPPTITIRKIKAATAVSQAERAAGRGRGAVGRENIERAMAERRGFANGGVPFCIRPGASCW